MGFNVPEACKKLHKLLQVCFVILFLFNDIGWVNTLVGGQKEGARGFMFFIINVDLTEEGLCK